jgi:ribonuclease R
MAAEAPKSRRGIIEVLGHKDDVGTDIVSIIRQFNLPEEFPEQVQQAAGKFLKPYPRKKLKNERICAIFGL